MTAPAREPFRLGFLQACELPDVGYVGGLLVTNHMGRPLEFQCTTPVRPNKTQEILYGPTLVPFIMSELLGQTLIEKIGVKPHAVFIEQNEILELRAHVDFPIFCFLEEAGSVLGADTDEVIGGHGVMMHADYPDDIERISARLPLLPKAADLREPFERVRDALSEALRVKAG